MKQTFWIVPVVLAAALSSSCSSSDAVAGNVEPSGEAGPDANNDVGQAGAGGGSDASAVDAPTEAAGEAGLDGSVTADGTDGAAGSDGASDDDTVPTSCIHAGVTPDGCNPVTNARCTDVQTCDFIIGEDFKQGFACAHIQDGDKSEGEACDNSKGPFCLTGMHCAHDGNNQKCAYMCCSDADCHGVSKVCTPLNTKAVGSFGFCR